MKRLATIVCLLLATAALAADAPPPTTAVEKFITAFNKGDLKAAEATHAVEVTIIDEVPPYYWTGRGAFKAWLADLTEHDAADGVTDGQIKLGDPIRSETSGDRAYVVVATEYSFKQNGTPMREPSQMTFALRMEKPGWRIVGWTFAGPKPTP